MGPISDMQGAFIMICVICAVSGWAVIEGLMWIISHIRGGWVA